MTDWQQQAAAEQAENLVRLDEAVAWARRALAQADGDQCLAAAGINVMYLRRREAADLLALCANALVELAQQRCAVRLPTHAEARSERGEDLLWRAIERGERL